MALKTYPIDIGGIEHTMQLSDEDARRMGVTTEKAAEPAKNKARTPSNKAKAPAKDKTAADDAEW